MYRPDRTPSVGCYFTSRAPGLTAISYLQECGKNTAKDKEGSCDQREEIGSYGHVRTGKPQVQGSHKTWVPRCNLQGASFKLLETISLSVLLLCSRNSHESLTCSWQDRDLVSILSCFLRVKTTNCTYCSVRSGNCFVRTSSPGTLWFLLFITEIKANSMTPFQLSDKSSIMSDYLFL